jgi:glycerophosphoryl diester phosphodiesterase
MPAPSHPLIIGHRGASGYRPEHTRAAYELAFALGADAVEPDIVATRDGVLVLRHENEISGTTDVATRPEFADRRTTKRIDDVDLTGWFTEDFTWAELGTLRARERMPALRTSSVSFDNRYPVLRLRDLFEIIDAASDGADRPLALVAELKHPTYFESIGLPLDELFAADVKDAGWNHGDGRLIIESFEQTVLGKIAKRGIRGKRFYLVESRGKPADLVAALGSAAPPYSESLTAAGLYKLAGAVDGVSVNKLRVLEEDAAGDIVGASGLVDDAHAAGLEIYCWTLRPENRFLAPAYRRGERKERWGQWQDEYRLIMRSGIDGVFVDHPDLAVTVRNET